MRLTRRLPGAGPRRGRRTGARLRLAAALAAAALPAVAGCAPRATPYRFGGPLTAAVGLHDVAEHPGPARPGAGAPRDATRVAGLPARAPAEPGAGPRPSAVAPTSLPERVTQAALPAPHRLDAAHAAPLASTVASLLEAGEPTALRALIGRRDPAAPTPFAVTLAAAVTGRPAPAPVPADGAALLTEARRAGEVAPAAEAASAAPGDLLVFDRALGDRPASLVAVVIGSDARGVVEVLYLARGVVRRGFLDVTRPGTARDGDGRVVNTYLRHGTDAPPRGTRYLAGELLAHRVRLR